MGRKESNQINKQTTENSQITQYELAIVSQSRRASQFHYEYPWASCRWRTVDPDQLDLPGL